MFYNLDLVFSNYPKTHRYTPPQLNVDESLREQTKSAFESLLQFLEHTTLSDSAPLPHIAPLIDNSPPSEIPFCRICGREDEISTTKGPQGGELCTKDANAYNYAIFSWGPNQAAAAFADKLTQRLPQVTKVAKKTKSVAQRFCGICGSLEGKEIVYAQGPSGSNLCKFHAKKYEYWVERMKIESSDFSRDLALINLVFAPRYFSPPSFDTTAHDAQPCPNDILRKIFGRKDRKS